jgi:transposase-like protein
MACEDRSMSGYDVIGDIHGHADKLVGLLREMGYEQRSGAWRHAERTAVFVGDLIDRGLQQRESIGIPRAMVEAGSAHMVLGNHEFNAIAYAQWSEERGDYCRSRLGESGKKHIDQHAAFINQIGRHCCVGGSGGGVACFGGSSGSVVLTDRVRVVACPGDFSSPCCISIVRWIPVPARRDLAGSALVSPLRPVLPRCRRTLGGRGIEVDHVTVYRWVQRFTPLVIEAARPCRHSVGDRWFVDETYVRVAGAWRYVYRAVDQHGQVIDVLVSKRRNIPAATRFFETMLVGRDRPREVTTDLAAPLLRVVDDLLPEVLHDTSQYANNRIECDHGRLKARSRPMRGRCAACERIGPRRS